ncbi:MAG: MaoC family dehydratase [Pseudomonadota bacterium]
MSKTSAGNFFEDYRVGQSITHAVPRTLTNGERALYTALYPARFPLYSSDEFARSVGLLRSPLEELAAFHTVFGKTVPDISLNAVANLGYAEGRFLAPVFAQDTLSTTSEVIGLKENSNGKTGIVYVRSTGTNQHGQDVMSYVRWVMVRKRNLDAPAPETMIPELASVVAPTDLVIPENLDFTEYDTAASGEPHRWGDYEIGERIDHVDGVTLEDAEHMMATRLWQNTAKVHFDTTARPDGQRLIYGGHIISLARALSFNGLANAAMIVAINAGAHANPAHAGMTVRAWSEVLDKANTDHPNVGAIRLRLVATSAESAGFPLKGEDGRYLPETLLDLDYWALMPI